MNVLFDTCKHIITRKWNRVLWHLGVIASVVTITLLNQTSYCNAQGMMDAYYIGQAMSSITETRQRKNSIAESYYSEQDKVTINSDIIALAQKIDMLDDNDVFDISDPLNELLEFTTIEGRNNHGETFTSDSAATDRLDRIKTRLERAIKNGYANIDEYNLILHEATRLYNIGSQRALECARREGDTDREKRVLNAQQYVYQEVLVDDCPVSELSQIYIRMLVLFGC